MKKTVSVIIALAVLCCPAALAAEKEPVGDGVTVIAYDAMAEMIAEDNPAVLSVMQAYRKLQLQLNSLESSHSDLTDSGLPLSMIASSSMALQSAMKELRDALKYIDRDINKATGGQLYAAQLMYLNHYILTERLETARRASEAARRDFELCRKKQEMGLVSQSITDAFKKGVTAGDDAVKALDLAVQDNLTALSDLLGINTPISLAGLPDISFEGVTERDLAADLAAYSLSAPDVQAKKAVLDKAKDALATSDNSANRYARDVAAEDYKKARALAERDFPRVYRDLSDLYEDFAGSTLRADAQKELDKLQKRFEAGYASKNDVNAAERALADANGKYTQEKISVYIALLQYEFGLTDWTE